MDISHIFDQLKLDGHLASVDIHFAEMMGELYDVKDHHLLLFALTSQVTHDGHSCFYPSKLIDYQFYDEHKALLDMIVNSLAEDIDGVGLPGELSPVIRSGNAYYLHRFFTYEQMIVEQINCRSALQNDVDSGKLKLLLNQYFDVSEETDWQKVAAAMAATGKLSVISGGPGTGKTTTVAKILAILLELSKKPLSIKIAAPTGKAAARLQDAIRSTKGGMALMPVIHDQIPEDVSTIHRLLGVGYGGGSAKFNHQHPLDADIVVIDEASMIDMAMMARLLDAVRPDSFLLFLGDKDQLSSVAPGSVLADMCSSLNINHFTKHTIEKLSELAGLNTDCYSGLVTYLIDRSVQLQRSYRYDPGSDIAKLAPLINEGEGKAAFDLLETSTGKNLFLRELSRFQQDIKELVLAYYGGYLKQTDPLEMFTAFEQFRILSGLRKGELGINMLNDWVEMVLEQEKLIDSVEPFYHGRPIMVTENDYRVNLFNGDVGLVLRLAGDRPKVFFPKSDGQHLFIAPERLPSHETVYAMTVHKSQGSEFDHVVMVLPDEESPIFTRELLYTAVTRSKQSVRLYAHQSTFVEAVHKKVERMSGLRFK